MNQPDRLQKVFDLIDHLNRQDPDLGPDEDGNMLPQAYLYGLRMSQHQRHYFPNASELLQIACRAQHIERWKIPRDSYPMGRAGYHRWRTDLASMHAQKTAEIIAGQGFDEMAQQRISQILRKQNLKQDSETQTLEDVACLVFLQYYLADFVPRHSRDKLISIIQKTWSKMSDQGHEAALNMNFDDNLTALINDALG